MQTVTLIDPDGKQVSVQVPVNVHIDDLEYLAVFKLGIPAERRPRISAPKGHLISPNTRIPPGVTVFYATI